MRVSCSIIIVSVLVFCSPLLAQNTVSYSHNSSGDLTSRFCSSGDEERRVQSVTTSDGSYPNTQLSDSKKTLLDTDKPSRSGEPHYYSIGKIRERLQARRSTRSHEEWFPMVDTTLAFAEIPMSSSVTPTGARIYTISIPTATGYNLAPEMVLRALGGV